MCDYFTTAVRPFSLANRRCSHAWFFNFLYRLSGPPAKQTHFFGNELISAHGDIWFVSRTDRSASMEMFASWHSIPGGTCCILMHYKCEGWVIDFANNLLLAAMISHLHIQKVLRNIWVTINVKKFYIKIGMEYIWSMFPIWPKQLTSSTWTWCYVRKGW